MDDIPRVWLERDPRDPRHVSAAMRLIAQINESYATPRTLAELQTLGISPNIEGMRVGQPDKVDAVICGFFFLDVGKLFPDNILVTCGGCRTALQIRPHTYLKARKLCCFCVVDEVLADYHAKSNE